MYRSSFDIANMEKPRSRMEKKGGGGGGGEGGIEWRFTSDQNFA